MTLLRWLAGRVTGREDAKPAAVTPTVDPPRDTLPDAAAQRALVAQASAETAEGRYASALAQIAQGLALAPTEPVLLLARAATLAASGRMREAADATRLALSRNAMVTGVDDQLLVGRILFQVGDYAGAQRWFRAAVAAAPQRVDTHANLAATLHALDVTDAALATYGRVVALDPRHVDGLIGLGNCHLDRGELADAEARFRQAIAVDADCAVAWRFLGLTFDRADREDEAIAAHRRAYELETRHGEDVAAFLGLAASLRDAGRFAEALALLEPNLQRLATADAQLLYGHLLLAVGRLPEGWHHSEFRWMTGFFLARRPGFARPVWNGQDLQGRSLLLRAEQGMGDTLQFARYARLLKARGATVQLSVPPELVRVARGLPDVDRVFVIGGDERSAAFDFYIPLLSVPRVVGTTVATIPAAVPYVVPDADRVEHWRQRFGREPHALRVGLVWGGNPRNAEDRFRSLPLAALAPLGSVPGVRFYSLQKGPRERDAQSPPAALDLVDLGPELDDFAETAAAITQLDLVITVCTSVAHLAGALGVPMWVLLHRAADWRWLTERGDSPWYPSARLFRQAQRGHWGNVIDRVEAALAAWSRDPPPRVALTAHPLPERVPAASRPREAPGFRPGYTAVAETRVGILEYAPDGDAESESAGWYGEWLQSQIDRLRAMIVPGSTIVEVGSGIGVHTLALAAATGETGHVLAYESRMSLRKLLRRNVGANRARAVTVMRRSIDGPDGVAGRPSSGSHALAPEEAAKSRPDPQVVAESVDDLWLARLDWLKVNEGSAAGRVLGGARQSLWRLRPRVHVGAGNRAELERAADALREYGYRCWHYETLLFDPANFNRRTDDIFAGRSAHALLAFPEETDVAALPRDGSEFG